MNESFALNQSQERELLCSIYEYFLWKKEQVNDKLSYSATNYYYDGKTCMKNDDIITSEYVRYQSVIEIFKKFPQYESDFKNMKIYSIRNNIPRLIKALFDIDNYKSQQQPQTTNQKASSSSSGEKYNNKSYHNCSPKLKRKIDNKENKASSESFKAKKRSRVSNTSPADINNTKTTTLSDATSTTVCDNTTKNDDIDPVKDKKKSAHHSETVENLHTRKETPAVTFLPTIDSNGDDSTPGAASTNASDSIKAKKKSRVSMTSPTGTSNTKTIQSNSNSTLCENKTNDKINFVEVTGKEAPLENSKIPPARRKEAPTIATTPLPNNTDSNRDNSTTDNAAASNNASDLKSEKRKKCFPTFDERFKDLEHFKAGNGHARVPKGSSLGHWVNGIRMKKRQMDQGKPCHNPLSEEQIKRLESLGFEWRVKNTPPVPFEQRLEALKKFKEIEGHCDVPRSYENDKSLGEWVHTLRTNYARKAKSLTAERIKKLENLGFNWVVLKKKTFEERLEECRHYRRQHGHLKIPPKHIATFENEEQKSFIIWCNQKRYDYKRWKAGRKTRLTKSKINKLDEIGFEWTCDDVAGYKPRPFAPRPNGNEDWDGRLQELKELKEKVGSCNSLPDFVKAGYTEQSRLYQWMKHQRKKWRLNSLSEEKMNKLKELDFDFHPRRHYAPYGSKKAAAKTQKSIEAKEQKSQGDGQCDEGATGNCSSSDDETSSESDNDEGKKTDKLQNSFATSAHTLYQGFGIDSCRL